MVVPPSSSGSKRGKRGSGSISIEHAKKCSRGNPPEAESREKLAVSVGIFEHGSEMSVFSGEQPCELVRRRGRPRKYDSLSTPTYIKRGRPPMYSPPCKPTDRKIGRPPKYGPVCKPTDRKIGRPPKHGPVCKPTNRKRGRSRKHGPSPGLLALTVDQGTSLGILEHGSEMSVFSGEQPCELIRKKRGRPQKYDSPSTSTYRKRSRPPMYGSLCKPTESKIGRPPKHGPACKPTNRKRGMPRKYGPSPGLIASTVDQGTSLGIFEHGSEMSVFSGEQPSELIGKKRGRPQKYDSLSTPTYRKRGRSPMHGPPCKPTDRKIGRPPKHDPACKPTNRKICRPRKYGPSPGLLALTVDQGTSLGIFEHGSEMSVFSGKQPSELIGKKRGRPQKYDSPSSPTYEKRGRSPMHGPPCKPTDRKIGRPPKHDPACKPTNRKIGRPQKYGPSPGLLALTVDQGTSLVEEEKGMGENQPSPNDHKEEKPCSPSHQQSQHMTASFLHMFSAHADISNMNEVDSAENSTMGKLWSCLVDSTLSSTLEVIMNKHGDIAKDCLFQSNIMLTSVLGGVCRAVQDLRNLSFTNLERHDLNSFYEVLKDAEHVKLNVKWLRDRVDEIAEALNSVKDFNNLQEAKTEKTGQMETIKKTMDSKMVEIKKLQFEIQALEGQVTSHTLEANNLKSSLSDIESKCHQYHHKGIMVGII